MENKIKKENLKTLNLYKSVRIKPESEKKAEKLLSIANKKKAGRKIKLWELFDLAIGLVTDEHLKMLQENSMTNEDRKEALRQKYIAQRGPISKDEFTGFMMTSEFHNFMRSNSSEKTETFQSPEVVA